MAFQLQTTAIDTLSASVPSIDAAVQAVKVSPEMIAACGSERSARFAAIASLLNSKEVDKLYTKAVLYARWKADFKAEKNTLYKSLSELAANCGESRQAFGALSKVGQVFFPSDKDAAAIAKRWTGRNYSPYILFDLAGLPYNLLDSIAETLYTFDVKENGDSGKITSGQARLLKEAFAACDKNVSKFMDTFMRESKDGTETYYSGDEFISRICNYKLYLCAAPDDDNSADDNSADNNSADGGKDNSEKSGFSNYLFIAPHMDRLMVIGTDGLESQIINTLSDAGYKIIASETNKRGVVRTFIHGETNDIRIIGVYPLSVKSLSVDVSKYNEKVKADMESKGVGEYFHAFTIPEYVETITKNENPLDYIRI